MAEGANKERDNLTMAQKGEGVDGQASLVARRSSLFCTSSFQDALKLKRQSQANLSVISLAQEPIPEQPSRGKPRVVLENTYQLEPNQKFESYKVKKIIEEVFESQLKTESYDRNASKQLCATLSEMIKNKVKELNVPRYRIVCIVSIGQLRDQGFRMGSQCVWDPKYDTFASSSYKNNSLFAVGTVFAVYLE